MGFVLFGEAGTFEFKPADYGLVPGDQCIVFCVGGGGAGCGAAPGSGHYYGNAGETTSFGSLLSALGGAGGVDDASNEPTGGSFGVASGGGGGWYPGAPITGGNGISQYLQDPIVLALSRTCGGASGVTDMPTMGGGGAAALSASNGPTVYGGKGSINGIGADGGTARWYSWNSTAYARIAGGGGAGFGAGGGGSAYSVVGNGGNGGEVRMVNYTIESNNPVAVTVGAGGAALTCSYPGGNGCNGCVCIVW